MSKTNTRLTPRSIKREISILREVADSFDNYGEFLYAINTVLNANGRKVLSRQAVDNWFIEGIPSHHVPVVAIISDGAKTVMDIRPDLFT